MRAAEILFVVAFCGAAYATCVLDSLLFSICMVAMTLATLMVGALVLAAARIEE